MRGEGELPGMKLANMSSASSVSTERPRQAKKPMYKFQVSFNST